MPKIIELPNNRVDLVFEINEGEKTGVKTIDFVGNRAYSDFRLKDVIKTSETNFLSFLKTTDIYDPDRIEADRDLLRRFYLKHGYADVRIVSRDRRIRSGTTGASSSPSRSRKASNIASAPSTSSRTCARVDAATLIARAASQGRATSTTPRRSRRSSRT